MAEIWFDTRLGEQIIGDAAIAERLEQSGPGDVVPLADMVLADQFPYTRTDFEKFDTSLLENSDEYIAYGRWVINLLSKDSRFKGLRRSHIERLGMLGVGPGRMAIKNHLNVEFGDYAKLLGEIRDNSEKFRTWTRRQYAEYALDLTTALGHKPTTDDFTAASRHDNGGPSPWVMTKYMGTPAEINELNGFPNVDAWVTDEPYIAWGARVIDINERRPLTTRVINILSARERGPSFGNIREQFGSLSVFQELALKRYQTDPHSYKPRKKMANARFAELTSRKLIPRWVGERLEESKVSFMAKYDLTADCLPSVSKSEYPYFALCSRNKLVTLILNLRPDLSLADLQLSAIATGHTDELWKLSNRWREDLVILPEDLVYKRSANRDRFISPLDVKKGYKEIVK